jgi:hypothetical protein
MIAVIIVCACIVTHTANVLLLLAGHARGFEVPSMATQWAFLLAGIFVEVITHEAGHRTAGAAMGWRCIRFGFGPFEFFRERQAWKRARVRMLWGAFVRQVPPNFHAYRRQKTITLVSGPLSSLSIALLFAVIALTSAHPLVFNLFGRMGIVSLLGVLELIPREKNGIGSDGYRLREVIRGGKPIDDMMREIMPEASNFNAPRYRDWPRAVVERLAATDDWYNIYLAYLHTLDAGDLEAASGYMRRLIALLPEEKPSPHSACEAAYWLATYGGDTTAARKWLERAGEQVEPEVRLRAEAAVALADGLPTRAISLANEALALMSTPPACGSEACEMDQLHQVLGNAAASIAAVTS